MVGLINNWMTQAEASLDDSKQPSWLQLKRQTAQQQLQQLDDPSRTLELWRYADVSRLSKSLNSVVAPSQSKSADSGETDLLIVLNESGYTCIGQQPEWLTIQSLVEMAAQDWQDITFDQETVVNLANTLLVQSGGLITVKTTQQPVHIKLVYDFADPEAWQYVRNHFNIAGGTKVHITEQHQTGRINAVNVYRLAAGAELIRQQDIQLNVAEQFVSYNQFDTAQNVDVVNMNHHIGGSLQHHHHVVNFNAERSKYKSGSINKSFDDNNITDIVNVNHHFKYNQSDVTHRSIAKDRSQIFNNAKAYVAVGADQTEIEQDLKNILLSPDAKIFSKPELEVYTDEVVAAHGSTIGALDDTVLFYLQSRGIDIEQSRDIMIESFEREALVC